MPLDERFDAAEPFGRKTGFFGPRNRQRRRRHLQSEETAQENGHAGARISSSFGVAILTPRHQPRQSTTFDT
jgi:hypothetical protein